ncbi:MULTISPECIES: hypothetical protein [unclassified Pseudovibrio]|uniref:hypothetical protein n=1 Tax=unclassified Pseudovibrio TaxID=2627060 RepID=UPI0007AE99AF|nr:MULTISPECIES: hypothetical protein [unclassified Pseudovibrio]KZL02298.1 hypothetical protein PsW74_01396 [Pseudovibrio sp. W74]KZL08158.1 hypothetical protein PsAD14_03305 [Pseudovibrio sp. Ad14]
MSLYLRLISETAGPLLQPVGTAEQQGHKLLDQIAPSFGEIALKREDLKQVLKETPDDNTAIAGQIRNLQDFYLDGWQRCQQTLNKLGRG